ncbi:hypothetical protein O181_068844 [Austropuccinia psidii MF-1]|uniref:Uncharacterized protein n=1 Tax=Austropuccinia psidii MF-1 TaxID=1389203 RepID=A0A9Q3EY34_9BASI|nr:hypothetical protein [Austropuccinia psidii MF-1]
MTSYNIWAGVEVTESPPEGAQVVIGAPGKGSGKRPNINATKKTNRKCHTFEATKYSCDQGDDMINVEVDHIDNETLHTKDPPYSMKQSIMKPLLPLLKVLKPFEKGRQLNMMQWVKI